MNDITASANATLPDLIEQAAAALATATSAAEVLDAKNKAGFAYTTAKAAARFAEAKNAHDAVVAACHKAMGDALLIEKTAQCRLADEYDAAQERGEIAKSGQQDRVRDSVPNGNVIHTTAEIGLTRKQVYEARAVRDAEKEHPGLVQKTIEDKLKAGKEPTRADVRRAIAPASAPVQPREAAAPEVRSVPAPKIEKTRVNARAREAARLEAEALAELRRDVHRGGDYAVQLYDIIHAKMIEAQKDLRTWNDALETAGLEMLEPEESQKFDPLVAAVDREKFDEWVEAQRTAFEEAADEVFYPSYDMLEAHYQSLKDVVEKHGLDWWEVMPALRITDSEKATEWFKHALAYYAEWDRLRVDGGTEEEWKWVHDDFYAHYREKNPGKNET